MRSCPRSVAACRGATRIAFACPARPERKNPWWARVTHFDTGPGQSGGRVTASKRRIPDQSSIRGSAHTGTSWRQTTSGPSPRDELDHPAQVARLPRRIGVAVEHVPGADDELHRFSGRRGYGYRRRSAPMHVVLADPPAFTPPYDHELASALGHAGATVELVTSPFRFGARPAAGRVRARRGLLPAIEHASTEAGCAARPRRSSTRSGCAGFSPGPPTSSTCSGSPCPSSTCSLLRTRRPLVFTAHDLVPRRTAGRHRLWRRLFDRFDRVVVHSERGRDTLAGFGVSPEKLRVIPHPVFRSDPPRADDGRTVLAPGVIRPYKGLPDAVRADARRRRRPPARRRRSPDPARRAPADRRRPGRVAARVSRPAGARARPVGGDGRRLPLPGGARPVRRAPAGARRGRPGRRLRRRRPRRGRRSLRRRTRRAAGGRRGAEHCARRAARRPRRRSRRHATALDAPATSSRGTPPRPRTSRSTRSSREAQAPRAVRRARRASAEPVRRGRRRAAPGGRGRRGRVGRGGTGDGGGGVRRLPARRRRDRRPPARPPRELRRHARSGRPPTRTAPPSQPAPRDGSGATPRSSPTSRTRQRRLRARSRGTA